MGIRNERGQATIEHLGLVAIVALVMLSAGAISAVAAPGLFNRVTGGFQRALCVVTGQACLVLVNEPCPERRQTDRSSQGVAVGWLRMGHDRVLFIERRSDGSYLLSLMEGSRAGAGIGRGTGRGGSEAAADASLTFDWKGGRQYVVATPDEARALVRRLRANPVPFLSTEVAAALDVTGLRNADQSVDAYVVTGGAAVEALATFGFKQAFEGGAELADGGELGVKIAAHRKEVEIYAEVDAQASVFLDAVAAELPGIEGSVTGSVALRFGPGPKLLGAEVVLSTTNGSRQRELQMRLDPSEPAVAEAIANWRKHPTDREAVRSLGQAAADYAALDSRTFAISKEDRPSVLNLLTTLPAAQQLNLDLTNDRAVGVLEEQRSRPSGGVWETRLDCGTRAAA